MRQRWPYARIVHELNVEGWGYRIDLAAITPDLIVMAEIKSDRDVLKRLPHQVEAMRGVCDHALVVVAPKHVQSASWGGRSIEMEGGRLHDVEQFVETEDGIEALSVYQIGKRRAGLNPGLVFGMLWASERRSAINLYGAQATQRWTCTDTLSWAVEHLTGRQVRQAVCAQLRSRQFARADEQLAA